MSDVKLTGRGSRWPAHSNRQIHADALLELALENPCRGICAHCGETFDGSFRQERAWFASHVCERAA